MDKNDKDVLARVSPSAIRRAFAAGVMGGLGTLLELLAFLRPPASLPLQLFLIVTGVVVLALCVRMWRATARGLVLYEDALCDSAGRLIATVASISRVERGMFAFKPSNGFLLSLNEKQPRAWAPGLWWRFGRRIGVGGAISGAEGRAMADAITVLVAASDEMPRPD